MSLAFPPLAVVSPGTPITSALWMSSVYNGLTFLANPPTATLVQATAQSSTGGQWLTLAFDQSANDTYGGHSNTTNNSRYTAQQPGWYFVVGTVCWVANSSNSRGVRITKNGSVLTGSATFVQANTASDITCISTPTWLVQLAVGDYVEIQAVQTTSGALNTSIAGTDMRSAMTVLLAHQ